MKTDSDNTENRHWTKPMLCECFYRFDKRKSKDVEDC
jgi:hypothetical protein